MRENMDLSIVIPSYSEEENLRVVLPRLIRELAELGVSYEVLVIDTMTPLDHTQVVCKEFGVTYIARQHGNAYGDAIRTGINVSRGNYLLFMDADGSHSPEFIHVLWESKDANDIVIASRYVDGGSTENPWALIAMSQILNNMYRFILNIKCRDVSNSFKLYRGCLLRKLKLTCDNFDVVEELLVRCALIKKDLSIVEIPFVFKKRMFGMSKRALVRFVFSFYVTLFRLLFIKLSSTFALRRSQP